MSQELLAEAIREEKMPRICREHRKPVYFDEPVCPCCRIEDELALHRWNERRQKELADRASKR